MNLLGRLSGVFGPLFWTTVPPVDVFSADPTMKTQKKLLVKKFQKLAYGWLILGDINIKKTISKKRNNWRNIPSSIMVALVLDSSCLTSFLRLDNALWRRSAISAVFAIFAANLLTFSNCSFLSLSASQSTTSFELDPGGFKNSSDLEFENIYL